MRAFIAMDADGTVFSGNNPPAVVPVELVKRLAGGHKVMVIGNSWLQNFGFDGPKDANGVPIPGLGVGKSRLLQRWLKEHPGYDRYVVVDDQPSQYDLGWNGWEFFLPTEFLSRIGEFL